MRPQTKLFFVFFKVYGLISPNHNKDQFKCECILDLVCISYPQNPTLIRK